MADRFNLAGKPGEEIFHEVDLNDSDDGQSGFMDTNEDGLPSPAYNYPRPYVPMSPQYIPHRGLARYRSALKHLIPVRRKKKKKKIINIDEAGFFSLITFSWMSKYIYLAYKKGLTIDDIPLCSPLDSSDLNAQRLELLWQDELVQKGPNDASFGRAVWKFTRTRVIIACIAFALSCMMGFLSPTIFMRKLLEYSEDPDVHDSYGVIWAISLTISDLLRTLFFALCWGISYRTATRLRAACLAMVYRKIMRLNSLGHESIGKLVNLYGNDGQRLFNMTVFGPMVIGGPLVAICGLVYINFLLGPWALLGMLTFLLFYPVQYGISRLTGYYRGKTILISDERVKLMTEILNSIKLIKMYAWENWFSSSVIGVRNQELSLLQKTLYCQSISISMAPTIPVISGIVTFLAHVLGGGNLTAAQAFSVLLFLTKQVKLSFQVIRDASLSYYEGYISITRFQAFPALTFATKQFRMALKHLQESCFAIHEGFVSLPRFKAFPLVTILHSQLRNALNHVRYGSENFIEGKITLSRLQDVLLLEENVTHISRQMDKSLALCINEGNFTWDIVSADRILHNSLKKKNVEMEKEKEKLNVEENEKPEILHSINFSVLKGSLVGICGSVGSGKSSLLLACLGQMKMTSGQLSRSGRTSYVSQQAWIENATLKENILFGDPFDPKRYINTLYCCALSEDVNLLPGGDETEIGERGVNLSGGQKQRVSLARALYSNRDIYFLDDPLSAVDAQVASHIFEKCILGALNKKTVIFVTHQIHFLQKCDEILVMKEGRIVERGTHHELLSKGREYSFMVQSSTVASSQRESEMEQQTEKESVGSPKFPAEKITKNVTPSPGKQLTTAEEQTKGDVRPYAYHAYIKAAGGYIVALLVILSILINVGSNNFSSWWLAAWIKAGSGNTSVIDPVTNETVISRNINDNPDLDYYMQVYGLIIVVILLTSFLRGVIFTKVTVKASEILHRNMYSRMICSPMRYFETTPVGRIQNLFSRDLDEVDARLPGATETMLQNIWVLMFSFLFITLVFPWFVVPLIILAVLYYFITKIFRVAIRDLKRIESISRSPIFGCVSATIQGLPTIHAFEKENEYISQFSKIFDENSTAMFLSYNAMRWMATRLDSISITISCITSLLVVALKGHLAPALAGLALTYAAHISGVFQFTVRLMSDTEARFISVERIVNHIEKLAPEGNDKQIVNVAADWPQKGGIKFRNVQLSYDKDLPHVLNGVSFSIMPSEKIGVVGRTGAGKSSLVVALFRLVELTSGKILVDNIDISCVSLSILRSRISVIPQDPMLFSGTLRSNLDPFNKYSDSVIWEALMKTKLSAKVKSMSKELNTLVGEGGDNLSLGERQLVCLARALLRGSKILVLDEATASVDPETEAAVHTTIEKEFADCTVITIAHRLSTVTNCNRVLVMDQGMVLEFDDPKNLLADPNSRFSKMNAIMEKQ